MVRYWVYDPDAAYVKDDVLSKTELVAYAVIIILVLLSVLYMLYISAGFRCPDCTRLERAGLVFRQVGGSLYALAG